MIQQHPNTVSDEIFKIMIPIFIKENPNWLHIILESGPLDFVIRYHMDDIINYPLRTLDFSDFSYKCTGNSVSRMDKFNSLLVAIGAYMPPLPNFIGLIGLNHSHSMSCMILSGVSSADFTECRLFRNLERGIFREPKDAMMRYFSFYPTQEHDIRDTVHEVYMKFLREFLKGLKDLTYDLTVLPAELIELICQYLIDTPFDTESLNELPSFIYQEDQMFNHV